MKDEATWTRLHLEGLYTDYKFGISAEYNVASGNFVSSGIKWACPTCVFCSKCCKLKINYGEFCDLVTYINNAYCLLNLANNLYSRWTYSSKHPYHNYLCTDCNTWWPNYVLEHAIIEFWIFLCITVPKIALDTTFDQTDRNNTFRLKWTPYEYSPTIGIIKSYIVNTTRCHNDRCQTNGRLISDNYLTWCWSDWTMYFVIRELFLVKVFHNLRYFGGGKHCKV